MEAGSKEDFHQTRAFGKEERVCGQAPAPQTSLVGGEHALGVRWGDFDQSPQEIVSKAEACSPIYQSHVGKERGSHGPRHTHIQQVLSTAAELFL